MPPPSSSFQKTSTSASNPPQNSRPPRTLCIVWDLDETLILLASLEKSARSQTRDAGCELRRCVLDLAARKFHLSRLGGGGGGGGDDDEESEDGGGCGGGQGGENTELSPLAADAASAYDSGPRSLLSAEASLKDAGARAAVDAVSGSWLRAASRLLAETSGRYDSPSSSLLFRHFLVTAAPLAPTLAKLVVCGLSEFFPSASVRCCWKRSKNGGCRKIAAFGALKSEEQQRGGGEGQRVIFLAVGNSFGDELAAEAVGWPFVRVGRKAVGKEFGDDADCGDGDDNEEEDKPRPSLSPPPSSAGGDEGDKLRPDALGRISTPMTRLTLLDLVRAAGALGG